MPAASAAETDCRLPLTITPEMVRLGRATDGYVRQNRARTMCNACPVLAPCRAWARENREYGFWGGESEEERAAAGFRVAIPIGDVARYPRGDGQPVSPRGPRAASVALVRPSVR